MTNEWREIESAPRDGTEILGWCAKGRCVMAWEDQKHGPWCTSEIQYPGWRACANGQMVADEGWADGSGFKLGVEPTHWMPLPEPPK